MKYKAVDTYPGLAHRPPPLPELLVVLVLVVVVVIIVIIIIVTPAISMVRGAVGASSSVGLPVEQAIGLANHVGNEWET